MQNPQITREALERLNDDEDPSTTIEGWRYAGRQPIRTARWHKYYYLVLQHEDGTFWGISYAIGLTEYQNHILPWNEDEDQELKLIRMYPRQIVETVFDTAPPKENQ